MGIASLLSITLRSRAPCNAVRNSRVPYSIDARSILQKRDLLENQYFAAMGTIFSFLSIGHKHLADWTSHLLALGDGESAIDRRSLPKDSRNISIPRTVELPGSYLLIEGFHRKSIHRETSLIHLRDIMIRSTLATRLALLTVLHLGTPHSYRRPQLHPIHFAATSISHAPVLREQPSVTLQPMRSLARQQPTLAPL